MAADGDSFLPRIQSVFYAAFDVRQGPKIVYQVPEGLISCSSGTTSTLFNFDDISKYVIPHPMLCGRLVICAARKYRIIGFPTQLRGKYERNYFRFNLCFVFDRSADLSCYEPVVRKVSRVLTNCEEESAFLSSPESSFKIHAILEQLYEDLNSYSETSISLDRFNSIELKIFPFYPNPPPVMDWTVPLALINLEKNIEPNWDLTMAKVCQYIDGINHVSRIAHLAECDVELTRQAISHLLFYQVIMTIDIFQYSNMYTLRKSIQWLADEAHVKEECGAYVAKPGRMHADWPKLLRLYSRLKPGTTVFEWMQEHDVRDMGIDVRRFTSFGVIKGFLRRVHRWPILLKDEAKNSKDDPSPSPPSPLVELLDGEHHTDELCTRFEVGWPMMEQWLAAIGGGKGEGDLGKVLIIYR
ncbi:nitrogen permease regulator 2 [Stereum hirsutum FP-91666 SS1]|uniref:nitrogen permease regulator 2 n=1 Tax=Stereum hirsutum (strain FP-91666) TaxID=721885 RepID=UPI000440AA4A|nr:nitrogen permease regulator 2 [Stereum hirsutum FP-91666 SS1]EIM89847.1 nitrogen permease regulator 2 [Stereum hirsutum FP-91666 SS1]